MKKKTILKYPLGYDSQFAMERSTMLLPSGYVKIAIEHGHRNSGYFPSYKMVDLSIANC